MTRNVIPTGFTMVEFILVVAISGLLIFGMGTLIEVPRQVVQDQDGTQHVSAVDRTLSVMDRDIRFARDVRTPDGAHLEVDLADGTTVSYAWEGGAGSPLVRTDAAGSVAVLRRAQSILLSLCMSTKQRMGSTELGSDTAVVEAASFDAFSLNPGYAISLRPLGGLVPVSLMTQVFGISHQRRAGLYFRTQGLDGDDATPVSFRARLRRYGESDLQVRMYDATGSGSDWMPDRSQVVATAMVPNASLPAAFTDFLIPLTAVRKCRNDQMYFVEMTSIRNRANVFCAEIEVQTLSIPLAAAPGNGGKVRSTDYGANYSPFTTLGAASQSRFSLQVMQSEPVADADADGPITTVQIATSVKLVADLLTQNGVETLHASFPIQNKLAEYRN